MRGRRNPCRRKRFTFNDRLRFVKTFSCGHKKTVANTTIRRNERGTWKTCRECYNSYARKYQKAYRKMLKKAS